MQFYRCLVSSETAETHPRAFGSTSAHVPHRNDQTQRQTEEEKEAWKRETKKEVEGVKAMLRQITLNELAALSEQDSFLNKTWKLEKKSLYTATRGKPWYSERQGSQLRAVPGGDPSTLHQIDYISEPSDMIPTPATCKAPQWRPDWSSAVRSW